MKQLQLLHPHCCLHGNTYSALWTSVGSCAFDVVFCDLLTMCFYCLIIITSAISGHIFCCCAAPRWLHTDSAACSDEGGCFELGNLHNAEPLNLSHINFCTLCCVSVVVSILSTAALACSLSKPIVIMYFNMQSWDLFNSHNYSSVIRHTSNMFSSYAISTQRRRNERCSESRWGNSIMDLVLG